jgi:hypothetical protein
VFIAEFNDNVVGSLIVVGDTPDLGLPIDIAFSDITNSLRGPGRSLAEMGVQIVAPAFRRGSVLTELQRCAYAHVSHNGHTHPLTIVTPVQRHFMEMINLHTMTEPRRWDPKLDDLVVLVGGDTLEFEKRVMAPDAALGELDDFRRRFLISENPYTERVADWDAQAQKLFEEPQKLLEVASKCYELWSCAKPHELRAMVRNLGADPTEEMDLQKSA